VHGVVFDIFGRLDAENLRPAGGVIRTA